MLDLTPRWPNLELQKSDFLNQSHMAEPDHYIYNIITDDDIIIDGKTVIDNKIITDDEIILC